MKTGADTKISLFETNEIRQVTEWILTEGEREGREGGKQNNSKQDAGVIDSWRDYAIVTTVLSWYSTSSFPPTNGINAGYLLH